MKKYIVIEGKDLKEMPGRDKPNAYTMKYDHSMFNKQYQIDMDAWYEEAAALPTFPTSPELKEMIEVGQVLTEEDFVFSPIGWVSGSERWPNQKGTFLIRYYKSKGMDEYFISGIDESHKKTWDNLAHLFEWFDYTRIAVPSENGWVMVRGLPSHEKLINVQQDKLKLEQITKALADALEMIYSNDEYRDIIGWNDLAMIERALHKYKTF